MFVQGVGDIGAILLICGALVLTFSVIALIGDVFAIRRNLWGVALTGAVLGLFSIGPVFLSRILSLIAPIRIAISRNDFR